MVIRQLARLFPAAALLLLSAGAASAQAPQQAAIFPPGGQVGTTVLLTIHGANLQGATAVLVSGKGAAARVTNAGNASALQAELVIAADAAPGAREVRVVTPRGTSNAGQVYLDLYPRVNETEPNNTPAQANALSGFPKTVNGQVNGAEDVDFFAFDVGDGETWVFDFNGARHGSQVDGFISVRDAQGHELKTAMEVSDQDPRIVYAFAHGGRYYLQVRDKLYRGGIPFTYSVNVGKLPYVISTLPMGGRRGETVELALSGVNLGDMKSVRVPLQPDDAGSDAVTFVLMTRSGPANPITLYAGGYAETAEVEPNADRPQATRIPSLPGVASGRIDADRDTDLFVFTPVAKQTYVFDLMGRRIRSRIDSVLRILDKDGKELTTNDDSVGKDSRLTWTAPAAEDYFIEVRSLDGHGSPDHFYRLEIRLPTTDFALTVTPDNPNIGPNGSAALTVTASRSGYAGEIALTFEGLPAGVTPSPALIRAGQNAVTFTLTAAADAAIAQSSIKVVGEGTVDGKPLRRVATPAQSVARADGQPPSLRPVVMNLASVTETQPFVLQIEPREVKVTQGQNVEITLRAVRKADFKAAINLTIFNNTQLPGVTVQPKPIPQDQTEVKITITAAANAAPTTQNLLFAGTANNQTTVTPALAVTVVSK